MGIACLLYDFWHLAITTGCVCTLADFVVKDENIVLTAAASGHPQVVEILIQATAGIDEAGQQVCIVSVVTVILPFFQMAKSIWFPSWPM